MLRKLPAIWLLASVVTLFGLHSQVYADSSRKNIRIDSVEIFSENVYDLNRPQYDNFLFRLANKMHIVTKKSVIARELLLGKGDVFDTALAMETARNLRSLPYLLKTEIYLKEGKLGEQIMAVNTSDKWTTTGGLSYHRVGGKSDLQIGIEENNLLGLGIFTAHDYFAPEDDRNFYQGQISDNRFLGKPFSLSFFYSDSPRYGVINAKVKRPYYSLSQHWGGGLHYSNSRNRLDRYQTGELIIRDRFIRDNLTLEVTNRVGSYQLKSHFTLRYEYTDVYGKPRKVLTNIPDSILEKFEDAPGDSIINYFQFTYRLQQINYQSFQRINRFEKIEDYNIGFDGRLYFGNAFGAGLSNSQYQVLGFWPEYSYMSYGGLGIGGAKYTVWMDGQDWLRKELSTYFYNYFKFGRNNTLAIGIRYAFEKSRNTGQTLYLDEDRGIRGFPAYLYGGEERLIVNIEDRLFSDIEILSVGVGAVGFVDIGNIWSRDQGFSWENTRSSIGAGLRFGVSRSTQAEIIRIDLAYAIDIKSWQISFGTGQYF